MNFLRIFENPHVLHAAAVHFPVALGVLGLPLVIVAALTKMRPVMRQAVLAVYLLLALAAFAATATGMAIPPRSGVSLEAVAHTRELHSFLGRFVWIGAMATAVLILLTLVRSEWFRAMFTVLGVLAATATAALIVVTAVHGQSLVYEHGEGTKAKKAPAPAAAAPATPVKPPAPKPEPPPKPAPVQHSSPELEGVAPDLSHDREVAEPFSQTQAAAQNKTAEEVLKAWRNRLKASGGGQASQPASRWDEVKDWCRKYFWPW